MGTSGSLSRLGFHPGMVVQELGWDEDADERLRDQLMDAIDADLVDESLEAVDAVWLWWRSDDGDVVDGLMDALTDLADDGVVWLLAPKVGREGHVDPADLAEGCVAAGLTLTGAEDLAPDWAAHKIVRSRSRRL